MRRLLLAMAGSRLWKRLLTGLPVTRRVVGRFIPGESLEEALAAVEELNRQGYRATLNPLGENVDDRAAASAATTAYVEILDRIALQGLDANVSVKLTSLGLDLGRRVASENLGRVLDCARRHGNSVRIDMEASDYVDRTLEIWRLLRGEGSDLGVVIQSYLLRTPADLERLILEGASIRLVKGAYAEPEEVAFPDKSDVDTAFRRSLDRLAAADARETGVRVAVASHDPRMLDHARSLIDDRALDDWEFQMLFGIGKVHQERLRQAGYSVRIYVSYGPSWYPWFMRRLAERPANLLFFLRHLFG